MKKQVKVLTTIIMVIMVIATLSNVVFGADVNNILDQINNNKGTTTGTDEITGIGAKIIDILQVVGIVVGIVVLLVIGIKYIMGSAEEKAEYKKVMIPYIVGAILIAAAPTIVKLIFNAANGLTK